MENQASENSWLMIMPNFTPTSQLSEDDKKHCSILLLPHPRTNKNILFVLKESNSKNCLYELHKHEDNPSSWLINNNFVKSDGSLLVATPFDPLFILLPCLLQEKTGKFVLLDQLVSSISDISDIGNRLLKSLKAESQLCNIADFAGVEDFKAYKYNEGKTLKWLKQKVERTLSKLKETQIFVAEQDNVSSEEALLQYACKLVCDYIPVNLHSVLRKYLGVKETVNKRKSSTTGSISKKAKVEPTENYSLKTDKTSNKPEKKSLTKAQKALSKVDKKGMKTMSSFFKVKNKVS